MEANFTVDTTPGQRMLLGIDFGIRVARTGHFTKEQREELEKIFEEVLKNVSRS